MRLFGGRCLAGTDQSALLENLLRCKQPIQGDRESGIHRHLHHELDYLVAGTAHV